MDPPLHSSQIDSQLSGQQQVKAIQNDQRCKHAQARIWPLYFGMRKVFCSSITLRKEEPSIANIIGAFEKKQPQMKKKMCSFTKTNAVCHKSVATMPQWLLVCRPQKNAPGKEIWLQYRRDIGNWDVLWGQRQMFDKKGIELFEKHWSPCITLEGDYVDK